MSFNFDKMQVLSLHGDAWPDTRARMRLSEVFAGFRGGLFTTSGSLIEWIWFAKAHPRLLSLGARRALLVCVGCRDAPGFVCVPVSRKHVCKVQFGSFVTGGKLSRFAFWGGDVSHVGGLVQV